MPSLVQVAASGYAEVVSLEDVSQEMLDRERRIELQKEDLQSKPEAIRYPPSLPLSNPLTSALSYLAYLATGTRKPPR